MHPLIQTIVPTVLVPVAVCGVSVLAASVLPPGRWRGALVGAGAAAAWCGRSPCARRGGRAGGGLAVLCRRDRRHSGPVFRQGSATIWRPRRGSSSSPVISCCSPARFLAGLAGHGGGLAGGLALLAVLNVWAVAGVARSVQAAATVWHRDVQRAGERRVKLWGCRHLGAFRRHPGGGCRGGLGGLVGVAKADGRTSCSIRGHRGAGRAADPRCPLRRPRSRGGPLVRCRVAGCGLGDSCPATWQRKIASRFRVGCDRSLLRTIWQLKS